MRGVSDITYGQFWRPLAQRSLRRPKGQTTQDRWIAGVFRDKDFSLTWFYPDGEGGLRTGFATAFLRYSELWSALASNHMGQHKIWLIGWRVRYALERANFLRALERGEVKLPIARRGENAGKHTGRLTMSSRVLEVDLECGKNRIKLLDWQNYGVSPEGYADDLCGVTAEAAESCLRDYLAATSAAGVSVSKTTAAQLGWSHCRRSCLAHELSCNLDSEARRLERDAYHGGRCEAFRLGAIPGTTYSLDVRSCYATICRDEALPCRLVEEYRCGLPVEQIETAGPDHWIADVVLSTDEADYPLRWDGSPIFPVGQFRTALPWPELRHALQRGRVVRVLRASRYVAGPVLREYAEWYLEQRARLRAADVGGAGAVQAQARAISGANAPRQPRLGDSWLKATFNASLGYTAREKYEYQPWDVSIPYPYWIGIARSPEDGATAVQAQKLDRETRWLKIAGEPREAMPFLHATICSYARVKLLDIFKAAGRENILYCDTDGILVTQAGAFQLHQWGEWMRPLEFGLVERFAPGSARILGQKTYCVGDNVIAAGVVGSRQSKTLGRNVLTTTTGRVDADGRVHPFTARCDEAMGWVNDVS